MANYILLATYTEQGLKGIKDTVKRTEHVKELAKKAGLSMKESYWTLGAFDVVSLFEAPDDETAMTVLLHLAALGNVHTTTVRGFTAAEMDKIVAKVHVG